MDYGLITNFISLRVGVYTIQFNLLLIKNRVMCVYIIGSLRSVNSFH